MEIPADRDIIGKHEELGENDRLSLLEKENQELRQKVKDLNAKVCQTKDAQYYVLIVTEGKENNEFLLSLEDANRALQKAISKVPLFQKNGAYLVKQNEAFFTCQ